MAEISAEGFELNESNEKRTPKRKSIISGIM